MVLDLLALALLVGYTVHGSVRGAFRSGVGLASWLGGYGTAAFGTARLAPLVANVTHLPFLLALAVAAVSIVAGSILFGLVMIRIVERIRGVDAFRSRRDRFWGAIFGALQGGLVVLLVGWLGQWMATTAHAGVPLAGGMTSGSTTSHVSGRVIEAGIEAVMDDSNPTSRLAGRLIATPGQSLPRLGRVLKNPRIRGLFADAPFWEHVAAGRIQRALDEPGFLGIAFDRTLRNELAAIGLVRREGAEDPLRFREDARRILETPWMRVLGENPKLRAIPYDPEIQRALDDGDLLTLLRHPDLRRLSDRAP